MPAVKRPPLGRFCPPFGPFWGHFGGLVAPVGVLWAVFGCILAFLVSFWELFVRFSIFFNCFGPFLVRTLSSLGPRAELLPQANEIDPLAASGAELFDFL